MTLIYFKKILFNSLLLFVINFNLSKYVDGNFDKLSTQRALNRTLTKIQNIGEGGRIVFLVCKKLCLKQRTQVIKQFLKIIY